MCRAGPDLNSDDPAMGVTMAEQARMAFVYALRERGIASTDVLRAMETVPRELFVPHRYIDLAWRNISLPIACGQTMPQPFALARLVEALDLAPHHRVLEIGTGSGYAAAILSRLVSELISFERFRPLHAQATARLAQLGFANIDIRFGDGVAWVGQTRQMGKFDRIIVHAACEPVPQALIEALVPGGLIAFARCEKSGSGPGLYLAQRAFEGQGIAALEGERFLAAGLYGKLLPGVSAAIPAS